MILLFPHPYKPIEISYDQQSLIEVFRQREFPYSITVGGKLLIGDYNYLGLFPLHQHPCGLKY
jgi:hypothetical protein